MEYISQPCGVYNRQATMQQQGGLQGGQQGGMQGGQQGGYQVQQPLPSMPTGYATGPTTTPVQPTQSGLPAFPGGEQPPVTVQSTLFTPGFLRSQIGKFMRVEFLLGNGPLVDRTGTLISVGASYILLRLIGGNTVMCDIYSIKFVTIVTNPTGVYAGT